jgi:hypothetical protein
VYFLTQRYAEDALKIAKTLLSWGENIKCVQDYKEPVKPVETICEMFDDFFNAKRYAEDRGERLKTKSLKRKKASL